VKGWTGGAEFESQRLTPLVEPKGRPRRPDRRDNHREHRRNQDIQSYNSHSGLLQLLAFAVRSKGQRSFDRVARFPGLDRNRCDGVLHSGAPRNSGGSNDCAAAGINSTISLVNGLHNPAWMRARRIFPRHSCVEISAFASP
jgi:hypothetical protein